MTPPEPSPGHLWLLRLLGSWRWESEPVPDVPSPPDREGVEEWRAIGQLWVQGESRSPSGHSLMTLGWDAERGRAVGTWLGSMMPQLWHYDGELEVEVGRLSLYSVGPSWTEEGASARYRDVIQWVNEDERLLIGEIEEGAGEWRRFMCTRYRRVLAPT
jgi:Protein of unknown function (DUF1579)